MRIATYNLNNLFERAKVFELEGFSPEAQMVLDSYNKLAEIFRKESYTDADKNKMADIIVKYVESKKETKYIVINQLRGKLYAYTAKTKKVTIKANGRADWQGFPELIMKEVNEKSTQNTARVIQEVNADILCTIEVESRTALENFNKALLKNKFKYSMLIDGNDDRGIDVGIYSNYEIVNIHSHIFDTFTGKDNKPYRIFSRDCAEYTIKYNNHRVHVLCNHFKSKGYGSPAANDQKRAVQAEQVKKIIRRHDLKNDFVVIAGDFNDTPDSIPLKSLLKVSNLVNVVNKKLPEGERGTYLNKKDEQIDYLLVSAGLMKYFQQVRIERRGIFKKNATDRFDTVTDEITQASDHAAVWADFDL